MVDVDPNEIPEIEFISSNKNKRLFSIDGYVYQQNKSTEKVSYWICEEKMCWIGVHLDGHNRFIKFTKHDHNHMPVPEGDKKNRSKKTLLHQHKIASRQLRFNQKKIKLDEFLEGLSLLIGAGNNRSP